LKEKKRWNPVVLISPSSVCVLRSYPFQILDQTLLVCIAEIQLEVPVVVIHDLEQGGKAAVVEEAALLMRLQSRKRRGAVPLNHKVIRRADHYDIRAGSHQSLPS
jgi:hypothetical protein